jgi:hypothetical protein
MAEIKYPAGMQAHYIDNLISDPDKFAKCRTILKDEYFDDEFRPTVRYLIEHVDQFRSIPSVELIRAKTGLPVTLLPAADMLSNQAWFWAEFEEFCRHKAIENVFLDGYQLINSGREAEVERRIRDAMTIRLQSDLGMDYFDEPAARLRRMLANKSIVSTGILSLDDKLYGGFVRGHLNLFLANSGVGKSLMLMNLSLNWALAGYNVVYLSLELDADMIALRLDAMLSERGTQDVMRSIDDAAFMIAVRGKKAGNLKIKKLPGAGTTCNDLRGYLKEYELKYGRRPDAVVVDYLDLMYPNDARVDPSNLFIKDKFVSEELRELMGEYDVFGASAGQMTRGSVAVQGEFDQSHVAGGISKINTSDIVISMYMPPDYKEKGKMELAFLKTRTSSAVGHKIMLGYNKTTMRMTDMNVGGDPNKPMNRTDLKQEIAVKLAATSDDALEVDGPDAPDSVNGAFSPALLALLKPQASFDPGGGFNQ